MASSAELGITPQERWGATFQPEHGTAERWDTCDCIECRVATGRPTAPALRRTLAALLHTAAEAAEKWEEAAHAEWAPHADRYHFGDGRLLPEEEGAFVEDRLARSWRGTLRKMADNLSADEAKP